MSEPKRNQDFRDGFGWGATTVVAAIALVGEIREGFSWFGVFMMAVTLLGLLMVLGSLLPPPPNDPLAQYRKP